MTSLPINIQELDIIKNKINDMIKKEKRYYGGICLQLEEITYLVLKGLSDVDKDIVYDYIVSWLRSIYENVRYYKETDFKNVNGANVGYLVAFNFH